MKKTALLSVSDKTGIIEFAKELLDLGYELIATGNTARLLSSARIIVTEISSVTGFPEIFNGRVKTLHPKIFGGILYRRDDANDGAQAAEHGISPVDIVCVNLYPFVKTVESPESTFEDIIENIDIGGPALIRAAAKNYKYVSVLTSPVFYEELIATLKSNHDLLSVRQKLAVEAFSHTAYYDTYIANYLEDKFAVGKDYIRINLKKEKALRYGENPHQSAALYGNFYSYFECFHGKELSYNNILDLTAAAELCEELDEGSTDEPVKACVIVKHNNPAGAAIGDNLLEAYLKALQCDPVSAFGGIVAFKGIIDAGIADKLNEIFLEIVCADNFTEEALTILRKKRDRRLVKKLKNINSSGYMVKTVPGGVISQDKDNYCLKFEELKFVTDKKPDKKQLEDLLFAWKIAKHTKSNAIVFARAKQTLGVGAGQMSRLDSSKIGAMKATQNGLDLKDSVAASDAFFPFADGLIEIIKQGAVAVIQPGGSVRDQEVIDAADRLGISMVFTGIRHFKH